MTARKLILLSCPVHVNKYFPDFTKVTKPVVSVRVKLDLTIMADDVGPLRTEASLKRALDRIGDLSAALGERPFGGGQPFDMVRLDWLDLRNMLTVARAVAQAALLRTESRGAHQREDFPGMLPEWNVNQVIRLDNGRLDIERVPASVAKAAAQ